MEFEDKITDQVEKSKLIYAFSLIENLVNSKDNNKIKKDLESVWNICGFKSQKKLEELFKIRKGISLMDYCKKKNPNCNC
tara:strand:- start:118 stop:357 length:240 start_codon:yes stop_codon:yes gene_type:complete